MPTRETHNLESVYKDEHGELFLGTNGSRLYLHAHLFGPRPFPLSRYKHFLDVLISLQLQLKGRGITELYTYVTSLPKYQFAKWAGFETTLEWFKTPEKEYEIMKKVL
jgi:hypothetical protein